MSYQIIYNSKTQASEEFPPIVTSKVFQIKVHMILDVLFTVDPQNLNKP